MPLPSSPCYQLKTQAGLPRQRESVSPSIPMAALWAELLLDTCLYLSLPGLGGPWAQSRGHSNSNWGQLFQTEEREMG